MWKTSVVIGAFFVVSVSAYAGPLMCLRYCGNEEFEPICGSNGKDAKRFDNMCELKNAQCTERTPYLIKDMRECVAVGPKTVEELFHVQKPIAPVHENHHPIRKHPSHFGEFNPKKNWSNKKQQNAYASRIDPCNVACSDYYLPICASDGQTYKTFSNMCFMEMANCNAPKKFAPASADNCHFNTGRFH